VSNPLGGGPTRVDLPPCVPSTPSAHGLSAFPVPIGTVPTIRLGAGKGGGRGRRPDLGNLSRHIGRTMRAGGWIISTVHAGVRLRIFRYGGARHGIARASGSSWPNGCLAHTRKISFTPISRHCELLKQIACPFSLGDRLLRPAGSDRRRQ